MKTLLILGGFGFVGSNILRYLESEKHKYEVIVFDKYTNHPRGLKFPIIKKAYGGDFSDVAILKKIFQENKIDLIIHAISSTVPADSKNIEHDIQTNLIPTVSLLNLCKEFNINNIIYISSGGAIYGQSENKLVETDDVFPLSSYGIVKLAIEKYLFLFSQQFKLRPLILRPSNLYGLYHYSTKQGIVNIAVRNAVAHENFFVWGDGNGKKDYLDVEDFCNILFNLVEKNVYDSVINIASGNLISINEIMSAVKELDPSFKWQNVEKSSLDVPCVSLDTTKLISYIGEYKFKKLDESLKEIYDWQKITENKVIIK